MNKKGDEDHYCAALNKNQPENMKNDEKGNKAMKKIALILAMAILCASFSAAGFAEEPMTISYVPQAGPTDPDGFILKAVEEKFNVKIDFWGKQSANTLLGSGDIPDVFVMQVADLDNFAREGVLAEIPPEFIKEHAPYLYEVWTSVSPNMDLWKIDGKNYFLPGLDPELGGASNPLVYRGDWLETLGFEKAPTNLEELEAFVYACAQKDPDQNGVNDTYGMSESGLRQVYGAFGFQPDQFCILDDGTVSYGGIQPQMKEALALISKWFKDGVISPLSTTGEFDIYMSTQFANGEVGCATDEVLAFKGKTFEGARIGDTYAELAKQNPEAAEKLVYATPVSGPKGDHGVIGVTLPHKWGLCIGKQVQDDPEKMARILELFEYYSNTVESWVFARFGQEGVHFNYGDYTFSNGKTCRFPQSIDPYGNWSQIVAIGGGTVFDFFTPMTSQAALPETAWIANEHPELIEAYQSGNVYYDAMYIKPAIWNDYSAELIAMREMAYAQIITGEKDIDYFDTFVQEWLNNGGQEVLDAIANGEGKILK